MPKFNDAGEALIKQYEGLRLKPYLDQKGIPTIGWGHTKGVTMDMAPITIEQAEAFFKADIADTCIGIINYFGALLNDNQFSALVSLCYNAGLEVLRGHVGLAIKAQDYAAAANHFLDWHYVNKVDDPGLDNRRAAERKLFLSNG